MRRALVVLAVTLAACTQTPPTGEDPFAPPPPGLLFSYPRNGQVDVPTGARVLLTFSDAPTLPLDAGVMACTRDDDAGTVTGALCLESAAGFVETHASVVGHTVVLTPHFSEGVEYQLYVGPSLLPSASNLRDGAPLLTFRTRSTRVLPDAGAQALFEPDAGLLFMDEFPLRFVFTEPLDPATVRGALLDENDAGVDGGLTALGVHVTFDPDTTLKAGAPYRFVLSGTDLGGEAFSFEYAFTPTRMASADGKLFEQHLAVTPPWNDGGTPDSLLAAMPTNTTLLAAQLVGTNTLGLLKGSLTAELGDPSAFGGPIPLVIRKGQRLDVSPLDIQFGGALESGRTTGMIHFTLLSDANGYLTRNPLRPPETLPNDERSPVFVDFTMDALVSSDDAQGNTMSTQTVLGIRLLGVSTQDHDQLIIDQVGALDFSTLGVNLAPVNMALRLRTGTKVELPALPEPQLVSSYPKPGATDARPDTTVQLNFTEPVFATSATVTLTQGATVVPTSHWLDGTVLIVKPLTRLEDGATTTLNVSGLTSLSGATLQDFALNFATPYISTSNAAPPQLTAVVPGTPCALSGGNASTPGSCTGGKGSDTPYVPFTLPANRPVHVQFSQPMNPSTFIVGAACGQGTIRIEKMNGTTCANAVEGTLFTFDRGFRFSPKTPWEPGQHYRLTLVGGSNDTCDANELCSRENKPLNTDALADPSAGAGGGPNVVINFVATDETPDSFVPLESDPFADQSGNGIIDPGETENAANRAAMEITGTSGVVKDATLKGADCLPNRAGTQNCIALHATLPVNVGEVLPNCPIDLQGNPAIVANPCVKVRVYPNSILATEMVMDSTAHVLIDIPINNVHTGALLMRPREPDGPAYGYIMREPGVEAPQFVIVQATYMDAPNLVIQAAGFVNVSHDLHSKALTPVLKGPVTFRDDGRMDVDLRSLADVPVKVNLSSAVGNGSIDLLIPAGEMHITLAGPVLR